MHTSARVLPFRRAIPLNDAAQEARVTAVAVTYNSADHIDGLVSDLRAQRDLRIDLIVVDNGSSDGTLEALAAYPGVMVISGHGNIGYAGGINQAMAHVSPCDAVLILNPDLRLEPDAVAQMWARMEAENAAVVVPRLLSQDGQHYASLRLEPTPLRVLGDAVLGARLARRPGWSTETVHAPSKYAGPHPIEWATGACLLVRHSTVLGVGAWDERYFLYSEEVDFMRRVREAGGSLWYEPAAVGRHVGGGSGTSDALTALMAVNKVRYAANAHGPMSAVLVRAALIAGALLRLHISGQRTALRYLLDQGSWPSLPCAERPAEPLDPELAGTIIVPAHDEEASIARTLTPLAKLAEQTGVQVIVAANGCGDATVGIARAVPGVEVLDLPTPSKPAALNAADMVATSWPRIYLDADIEIIPSAVADTIDALSTGALAARPAYVFDTAGASWPVRAYYRARRRMPSMQAHLWGAGVYGLSEAGHERLGTFPDQLGDDLYVDSLFSDTEKQIVETTPVVVRTPRTVRALVAVMRRNVRGNQEHGSALTTRRTLGELVTSVRSPLALLDAACYAALTVAGRHRPRRAGARWERDETSRA